MPTQVCLLLCTLKHTSCLNINMLKESSGEKNAMKITLFIQPGHTAVARELLNQLVVLELNHLLFNFYLRHTECPFEKIENL